MLKYKLHPPVTKATACDIEVKLQLDIGLTRLQRVNQVLAKTQALHDEPLQPRQTMNERRGF